MNNRVLVALCLALGAASTVSAKLDLVAINSQQLLLESKRGQALQEELKQQATELQEYQQSLQADLQAQSENLQQQAKALSPQAQQEQFMNLKVAERKAQRELQGRNEDLQMLAQQKQDAVRRELVTLATNMLEEQEWGMLVDTATPGVLASNKQLDVTSQVVAKDDALFEQELEARKLAAAEAAQDATEA